MYAKIDYDKWHELMVLTSSPLTGLIDPTEATPQEEVKALLQAKLDQMDEDVTFAEAMAEFETVRQGIYFHDDSPDASPYFRLKF